MVLKENGVYDISFNGRLLKVEAIEDNKIAVQGHIYKPEIQKIQENLWIVNINNFQFHIEYFEGRIFVNGKETDFSFRESIPKLHRTTEHNKDKPRIVQAMIPGIIVDIIVTPGEKVKKSQPLLYLEAMKMRNEIRSPIEGTITTINVKKDFKVAKGDTLLVVKPLEIL